MNSVHGRLSVERVPLLSLREEWSALAARARTQSFFVSWAFISTWWEHFRRRREGRVFLLREPSGSVAAIVPLYVEECALRFGTVRVLRNVGFSDVVNPDFLDVLVPPGREDAVADALMPALREDTSWEYAEFSELASDSSLARMAQRWERVLGAELRIVRRGVCPYITLPESYEDFLRSRNAHFRHQLRRYRRKIERELGVVWKRVGEDAKVGDAMVALTRLHQERMEATGRGGNFAKRDYFAFHRELAERLQQSGELYFWLLYVEGTPIASHYGFLKDDVYFGYQMGFSPRYHKWSPGHYMTGVVLEKLIAQGVREMNLLRGTDRWKYRWTDQARETITCSMIRPAWRSRSAFVRASLSASPPLALRFIMGRDSFEELRDAWKRARTITS